MDPASINHDDTVKVQGREEKRKTKVGCGVVVIAGFWKFGLCEVDEFERPS